MSKSDQCSTCGKPKKQSKGLSITQWIFAGDLCECHIEAARNEEVERCEICGYRKTNRKGSITQWIFTESGPRCTCKTELKLASNMDLDPVATDKDGQLRESVSEDLAQEFPIEDERYSPVSLLASGNSQVYKCLDKSLGRYVALKILSKHSYNEQMLIAFQNEAKITSKLSHPNILSVFDFGVDSNNELYMVSEFIDAIPLNKVIENERVIETEKAIDMISQIADALSYAHGKSIFHRDITPSNIMLIDWGANKVNAKLIDFGIAMFTFENRSHTYEGLTLVGTPNYMSPDQLNKKEYDQRSEIYSLACVLFEILTGRPPFVEVDVLSVLQKHVEAPVPMLNEKEKKYSDELEAVLKKALAKEPDDRFQTMNAFREALSNIEYFPSEEVRSGSFGTEQLDSQLKQRNPKVILITVFLILFAGASLIFLLLKNQPTVVSKEPETNDYSLVDSLKMSSGLRFSNVGLSDETDETIRKYKQIRTKKNMDLTGSKVTDNGLDSIVHLPLESLGLGITNITDKGLKKIAGITTLEKLDIRENHQLSSEGYAYLVKLKNLESLEATGNDIDVPGLKNIAKIKTLKNLVLSKNKKICNENLSIIQELPNLESLYLTQCPITVGGIKAISRLRIKNLILRSSSVTDSAILILSKNTNIIYLGLADTKITDLGLGYLEECNQLKFLNLSGCSRVTAKGMDRLRKKLPHCKLIRKELIQPIY